MRRKRRTFDASFKLQVVEMLRNQGLSISQVCRDLDLVVSEESRWVEQVDAAAMGLRGIGKPLMLQQQCIRQLEAENRQLRQENDLLRNASAFLARQLNGQLRRQTGQAHGPALGTVVRGQLQRGARRTLVDVPLTHEDIVFLQYTRSTAGIPKGVTLTHGNPVANLEQASAWIGGAFKEGEELIVTPLPLHHGFALTADPLAFVSWGANKVLITNPHDIPAFAREPCRTRFTAITGVNTLLNLLLGAPDFEKVRATNAGAPEVAVAGGMPVPFPQVEIRDEAGPSHTADLHLPGTLDNCVAPASAESRNEGQRICPRAAIVMVPGAVPKSMDDPPVVAFATSLARAVLAAPAPEIKGFRELRIRPADARVIADAFAWFASRSELTPDGRAGMFAFSCPVGPALLAQREAAT